MAQTDRLAGYNGDVAVKVPCRVATTANLAALSGLLTVDGVVLAAGDRVLVKDQTSSVDNGTYIASAIAWQRASDWDGARDVVNGTLIPITSGTTQSGLFFSAVCVDPAAVGSSSITFTEYSLAAFLQLGTGAVARTLQDKERESVTWKDFMTAAQIADVEAYTALVDVTVPVKAAIAYAQLTKRKLKTSWGNFLITDSLSIASGTQIEGETEYQYVNGFGIAPKATTITFAPATQKSLFVADGATTGGFRFHISVKNLFLSGNSARGGATTSLYALDVQSVIYSHFENIGITGFNTPVKCTATVNNRFVNMYLNGTVSSLIYAGSTETTDVWEQCSYWGSPLGVSFLGSSVAIRFSNCLWEQIDTYGMDVAKECQNILVENAYAEDCPFTSTTTNAMFRVGYTGTAVAGPTSLQVIGGQFSGRNAGTVGSFLDVDYCNGVQLTNVGVSRFTNVIKTSANTALWAISCAGIQWLSCTTRYNDSTKIAGFMDFQAVNAATGPIAFYTSLNATNLYGNLIGTLSGVTDGSSAAAGLVGERISAAAAATNIAATSTYQDLAYIDLTAGDWDISFVVDYSHNGATFTGACTSGVGTTPGNSGAGLVYGDTEGQILPPTATADSSLGIAGINKNITATTRYYLKVVAAFSAGTPQVSGRITARRIR